MNNKTLIIGSLASLGFLLSITSSQVIAQMTHGAMQPKNQFQKVEQSLWLKGFVTVGGLGLIRLELWWFLWNKPHSQK